MNIKSIWWISEFCLCCNWRPNLEFLSKDQLSHYSLKSDHKFLKQLWKLNKWFTPKSIPGACFKLRYWHTFPPAIIIFASESWKSFNQKNSSQLCCGVVHSWSVQLFSKIWDKFIFTTNQPINNICRKMDLFLAPCTFCLASVRDGQRPWDLKKLF